MKRSRAPYVVALVLVVAVLAPLLYGYARASGRVFTWSPSNLADYAYDLSYVEQGRVGRWLGENLYTLHAQKPLLLHPSYLLLGHVARWLHVSSATAFVVARVLAIVVVVSVLWRFLGVTLRRNHAFALTAIAFSGGLGFLPRFGDPLDEPMDAWLGESTTFGTSTAQPHFALALAAKVAIFALLLRRRPIVAGMLVGFLVFDHPFDVVSIAVAVAAFVAWDRQHLKDAAVFALISGAWVLLGVLHVRTSALHRVRMSDNLEALPTVLSFALGLGPLALLAMVGARNASALVDRRAHRLIVAWAATNALLMFALPNVWFARRVILGAHVPMALLASLALARVRVRHAALALLSLSQVVRLRQELSFQKDSAVYLTAGEHDAFVWVTTHTAPTALVQPVPNRHTGATKLLLLSPAWTARKELCGHPLETPNYDAAFATVARYSFMPTTPLPVDYVIVSDSRGGVTVHAVR